MNQGNAAGASDLEADEPVALGRIEQLGTPRLDLGGDVEP
jgi:hypothetical protein